MSHFKACKTKNKQNVYTASTWNTSIVNDCTSLDDEIVTADLVNSFSNRQFFLEEKVLKFDTSGYSGLFDV